MDDFFEGIYRFLLNLSEGIRSAANYINSHPLLLTLVILILVAVLLAVVLVILYKKLKGKFLERLVYKREFSVKDAYAGETVELYETIYNPTFFPLFRVDVEEYFTGGLWLDGMRPGAKPAEIEDEKLKALDTLAEIKAFLIDLRQAL